MAICAPGKENVNIPSQRSSKRTGGTYCYFPFSDAYINERLIKFNLLAQDSTVCKWQITTKSSKA